MSTSIRARTRAAAKSLAEAAEPPVEPPPELRAALAANPRAQQAWDAIATSERRGYADFVAGTDDAETRARRVANSVQMLAARALALATRK